jgi:hypothetical protein
MKRSALFAAFGLCLVCVLTVVSANASPTIIYDNSTSASFKSDATAVGSWEGNNLAVDNSFTLTSTATINEIMLGIWLPPGDPLTNITGGFYTEPFAGGIDMGSGTIAPYASQYENTLSGYDIYEEFFDIGSMTLGPGTYYLALFSGTTKESSPVIGWDWSGNSSTSSDVWDTSGGLSESGGPSTTFTLYGTESVIPEPSSLLLLGSGLAGLVGALRRKLRA